MNSLQAAFRSRLTNSLPGKQVTQIAQGSSVVQIAYDADGRRTSLTLPNGVIANYAYDADSHLTGITYTQGGSVLGDLPYTYDSTGRVATVGGSLAHRLSAASVEPRTNADRKIKVGPIPHGQPTPTGCKSLVANW